MPCPSCLNPDSPTFCDDRCRDWEIMRVAGMGPVRIWYETAAIVRGDDGAVVRMFLFPHRPVTCHLKCDEWG